MRSSRTYGTRSNEISFVESVLPKCTWGGGDMFVALNNMINY